jgi:hypothetical protein
MSRLPFAAFLLSPLLLGSPAPLLAQEGKPIDLVICLDVSNSMDGLIDSAKLKLWDIVNELAKAKPTPNLRVSLYSYGHNGYPKDIGWVRKDLDLSTDLDEVYKQLNALRTGGGTEYATRVARDAILQQKWSDDPGALRIMFVCGNEPANQDGTVTYSAVAEEAKRRGVLVNTIYCGPANHPEAKGWHQYAEACGGKYANIDQDKARRTAAVATPFDKEIVDLGEKMNGTYVAYGESAKEKQKNQVAQDANAAQAGGAVAAARGVSKATGLYRNSDWDLVDKMQTDPKFDIKQVKDEELCDEMKKLKPEERLDYLKKKAAERDEIKKKIADLNVKRTEHLAELAKKQPRSEGEKALDEALKGTLREQAAAKGIKIPD